MQKKLPVISIVTPTLNQVSYIEQTIQSVLTQDYPDIEYIIVDGGSTDGTEKIIKKYRNKIIYLREKDNGQTDAINKGLRKASGEIVAYLNSDDYYQPHALKIVTDYFLSNKDTMWVTGRCRIVDENNREIRTIVKNYKNIFLRHLRRLPVLKVVQFISQPATFWRKRVHKEIGYFDETLSYTMDYDFWLRLFSRYNPHFIDEEIANFRVHPHSKTGKDPQGQFLEELEVAARYNSSSLMALVHRIHTLISRGLYKIGTL